MASVNPLSRELVFKIVYYGPGLCGKTTTLEHLHATAKAENRGKLVSLATPVDRTLYFDFLPVRLPPVRGMKIRLQLFTVPGQVYFNATRKLVLTGADGVVFVSDSQAVRADANLESLENLKENLLEQGRDLARIPLVFQHNKRDLRELLPVEELDQMLNPFGAPSLPTCAVTGEGVYESLERISVGVLSAFRERLPDSLDGAFDPDLSAIEGGLAHALRDASAAGRAPPDDVVVAHLAPPLQSLPPELASVPPAPVEPPPHSRSPSHLRRASDRPLHHDDDHASLPLVTRREVLAPNAAGQGFVPAQAAAPRGGVSFAELWPEGERDTVREVEDAIQKGKYWRAIELCEALVSRILAGAAGLFGSSEAPRDPAIVPILLGLDGRRYLSFRNIVREARTDGLITSRDALAAFAFAVDARLARSSIH
ncbi:MAG TPA: GTPase domain-containing protein [Minicystis sp.]|nr:GTPase domain-containing protein [Minicystis sp.]